MPDIKDPHKPGDDPLIEENPGADPPAAGDDIPPDNQPESKLPGPLIGVWDAYEARPPYQQNDYIGWITRAKLPATREKRLAQMLDELERGDVYMKMAYSPKKKIAIAWDFSCCFV